MIKRRDLKKKAKHVFRKHYGLLLLICLFVAVLGNEFKNSTAFVSIGVGVAEEQNIIANTAITALDVTDVISKVLQDGITAGKATAAEVEKEEIKASQQSEASKVLGRSRGVLAHLMNEVSSGSIFITILSAIYSIIHSSNTTIIIFILGSLVIMLTSWYFIKNTLAVILRRITLECRTYEKVSMSRLVFLIRVRRWCRVAWNMFVLAVLQTMWNITIIGGIIKRYSYRMVPFILAENPSLKAREAITLSRRIMQGHKYECFVLDVTFWGWNVLGILTLGVTKVFFSNPYKICTFSEYYTELRKRSLENEIEGVELLNDVYLYEKASRGLLEKEYADIWTLIEENETPLEERKNIRKIFANIFGVVLRHDDIEKKYEAHHERAFKIRGYRDYMEGKSYPNRLFTIPEKEKEAKAENISYLRCYSITSLIMLFFGFSFIGWVWEVSLHLIRDGLFINRGVLHGPWLPIYGAGGILILTVLFQLRKHPVMEFTAALILCGSVEYFSSYYMEITYDGKKWWDYSGYFLNLNGRICAEGLLVFGLGGMAIVYVLAPLMDNLIRKIKLRIVIPICLVLVCVFVTDNIYSHKYPNAGKGITDYKQISYQADLLKYNFDYNG